MPLDLSRRSFFSGLGALIAAPAIVKASSLMPVTGGIVYRRSTPVCSKNHLLTINQITREAISLFRNSNQFLQAIDRDDIFDECGGVIGSTLRIRLPSDFQVEDHWISFNPPPDVPAQDRAFFKAHMPASSFADWEKGLRL